MIDYDTLYRIWIVVGGIGFALGISLDVRCGVRPSLVRTILQGVAIFLGFIWLGIIIDRWIEELR